MQFTSSLQQIGFTCRNLRVDLVDRRFRILLLQEVPQEFRRILLASEFLPSSSHFGFGRQALDFGALRLLQVADLLKIVARTGQRRFGFAATILVLAHAGGFFQIHAQLLRLGLDEVADHALADDRIGAGPQAGAHEDVLHVSAAHLLIVDEVRIAAVARDDALDGKLRIAPPGPLDRAVGVVEHQFDRSAGRCRTIHRTRKNEFAHGRRAAQFGDARFAQHPSDGVNHIGFAAAIGADNTGHRPRKFDDGGIGKALEAGNAKLF